MMSDRSKTINLYTELLNMKRYYLSNQTDMNIDFEFSAYYFYYSISILLLYIIIVNDLGIRVVNTLQQRIGDFFTCNY